MFDTCEPTREFALIEAIVAALRAELGVAIEEQPGFHDPSEAGPVNREFRVTARTIIRTIAPPDEDLPALLSRVLGKDVRYKQVDFEEYLQTVKSGGRKPGSGASSRNLYGELERKPGSGDSFFIQHIKEVVIDHQNGVFEGTNDLVEKLGGRPPMTLEAFIIKHRKAFE